jgi:hypothetical protein
MEPRGRERHRRASSLERESGSERVKDPKKPAGTREFFASSRARISTWRQGRGCGVGRGRGVGGGLGVGVGVTVGVGVGVGVGPQGLMGQLKISIDESITLLAS